MINIEDGRLKRKCSEDNSKESSSSYVEWWLLITISQLKFSKWRSLLAKEIKVYFQGCLRKLKICSPFWYLNLVPGSFSHLKRQAISQTSHHWSNFQSCNLNLPCVSYFTLTYLIFHEDLLWLLIFKVCPLSSEPLPLYCKKFENNYFSLGYLKFGMIVFRQQKIAAASSIVSQNCCWLVLL